MSEEMEMRSGLKRKRKTRRCEEMSDEADSKIRCDAGCLDRILARAY
jgi:hypothetical protein